MTQSYPPGSGHDILEEGKEFFLSLLGTNRVATTINNDLYFRPHTGNNDQKWLCVRDNNNHLGLKSKSTGGFMSKNASGNISVLVRDQGSSERFHVSNHHSGGFRITHLVDDILKNIETAVNGTGTYLRVGAAAAQFGVHLVGQFVPPFRRFAWVTPGELARSSAPYYEVEDSDQNMDDAAIQFLVDNAIGNIISVNEVRLAEEVVRRLVDRAITYLHSPIADFGVPTIDEVRTIHTDFNNTRRQGKSSLVYCGYGHGRTGTIVSALQILDGRPLIRSGYRGNRVETKSQMDFLDSLPRPTPL